MKRGDAMRMEDEIKNKKTSSGRKNRDGRLEIKAKGSKTVKEKKTKLK